MAGSPYDTFSWSYPCIWEGATDANSNGAVSALINWLIDVGYTPVGMTSRPSGKQTFTAGVTAAVKRYQQANGLKVDGVVGHQVWEKLAYWTTLGGKGNCPRCAGQYEFGQMVPVDCTTNRPPTQDEILQRIAAGEDPEKVAAQYGLDPATLPKPPETTEGGKGKGKFPLPWWAIPVGLVAIGGGYWAWKKWR